VKGPPSILPFPFFHRELIEWRPISLLFVYLPDGVTRDLRHPGRVFFVGFSPSFLSERAECFFKKMTGYPFSTASEAFFSFFPPYRCLAHRLLGGSLFPFFSQKLVGFLDSGSFFPLCCPLFFSEVDSRERRKRMPPDRFLESPGSWHAEALLLSPSDWMGFSHGKNSGTPPVRPLATES